MVNIKQKLGLIVVIFSVFLCAAALTGCEKSDVGAETVTASVLEIEEFGHAQLDLTIKDFNRRGYELGDIVTVTFDGYEEDMPYFDGYYSEPGEPMLRAYQGETNIGVCINYGNLSEETGIEAGDEVIISLKEKAGALQDQIVNSLEYSYDREDFESDAVFGNFREVKYGDIADGRLYRSSSPIDNDNKRAKYVDDLMEEAGIMTVMNTAEADEDIGELFVTDDFDSPYYKSLYEQGGVITLGMSIDFRSDDFSEKLVEGLEFLIDNEPPYLIHCKAGKDRTGFMLMILEGLMGADMDEIIDDYMLSFDNLFGVNKESEPEKYDLILEKNLMQMMYYITGIEEGESLEDVDMQKAVTQYLLDIGMKKSSIQELKEKLS